jgi:NTP pyrophosphatase (non-canonical NTP hydrolase)
MRQILTSVDAERDRQDAKWGEQNHHPAYWMTVLSEEVGEAAEAILEGDAVAAHKELVEVAAVACAAAESIERNGGWPALTTLQQENKALRAEIERLRALQITK